LQECQELSNPEDSIDGQILVSDAEMTAWVKEVLYFDYSFRLRFKIPNPYATQTASGVPAPLTLLWCGHLLDIHWECPHRLSR